MRRIALWLVLLAVSLAAPAGARADTGWSVEIGAKEEASSPERPAATLSAQSPWGPPGMVAAFGSAPKFVAEWARFGLHAPELLDPSPHDAAALARRSSGEGSRIRSLLLRLYSTSPSVRQATSGVVGFHLSPAPPLS